MIRDQASEQTSSKVDWAQFLLQIDSKKDLLLIAASKEKIAHEILRLRSEVDRLVKASAVMSKAS